MKTISINAKSPVVPTSALAESALRRVDKVKRDLAECCESVAQLNVAVGKLNTRLSALEMVGAPPPPVAPIHTTTVVKESADLSPVNVQLQELSDSVDALEMDLSLLDESIPDLAPLQAEIRALKRNLKLAATGAVLLFVLGLFI